MKAPRFVDLTERMIYLRSIPVASMLPTSVLKIIASTRMMPAKNAKPISVRNISAASGVSAPKRRSNHSRRLPLAKRAVMSGG